MKITGLTDTQLLMIELALTVAAEEYDKIAATHTENVRKLPSLDPTIAIGANRIAEQFKRQASEARDLRDKIENRK